MKTGGGGGHGSGNFRVGGLVGRDVGRVEVLAALCLAGFENVGRQGRATKVFEGEFFHKGTDHQLAAWDGFFHTEERGGGRGALEGVWKKIRAWCEAFGRGAKGGPPARAGFFQKQKFCAVLGADHAGGNDFGVVEDQEVCRLEQTGQVFNIMILKEMILASKDKESGRVPWMTGVSGDPIGG